MCELLVRIKDKVDTDIYVDVGLPKRGDVITIQEDGWGWSAAELKNPEWQIIKYPGVSVESLMDFITPEVDRNPDVSKRSKMLQRRTVKIDLDNLPSKEVFAHEAKAERTTPFLTFDKEAVVLDNYKITKEKIADPAILEETDKIT